MVDGNAGTERQARTTVGVVVWGLVATAILAQLASGVGVDPPELAKVVPISAVLFGFSAFYGRVRPDERLSRLFRACAHLFLISFACGSLSYAGASLGRPLWDDVFLSWDRALGFDWRGWLAVVDAHPRIHVVLAYAYHSMMPQYAILAVALATVRANRALDTFVLAFAIAAFVTVAIAAVMPALSPLVHLGITPADHPNIVLAVPLEFQEQAQALRDGTMRLVDLSGAQGLVTFPSFHTASAVLLILGFRRVPVLRWAGLALNLLMLVAIPIEGSHYIVDVIAGAAVAVAAWAIAGAILDGGLARLRRLANPGQRPALVPDAA